MSPRRSRWFGGGWSEGQREGWSAIYALRIELLVAATMYGVWMAMGAGGVARAAEWHEWLEWVMQFMEQAASAATGMGVERRENWTAEWVPEWPSRFLGLVVEFQRLGAASLSDQVLSNWEGGWNEQLERLARTARAVEEVGAKPLGEIRGELFGDGVALLGAIEDSLVLSLSADEARRALRSSSEEVYGLLMGARRQGIWDFFADA